MMQEMWIPLRSKLLQPSKVVLRSFCHSRTCASLRQPLNYKDDHSQPSTLFVPGISKCDSRTFYSSHAVPHCLMQGNTSSRTPQRLLPNPQIFSSVALHTSTDMNLRLFQSTVGVTSSVCNVSLELFNKDLSVQSQLRFIHRHSARNRVSRKFSSQKNSAPGTTDAKGDQKDVKVVEDNDEDADKKLSVYQRFKKTYKEHGKVLVVVHLLTSSVWLGMFYTAAKCGVDVVPLLEKWNLNEKFISPFRSGELGSFALAYLMYKLATPARYTVTLGGTNLVIRRLKKQGKMEPVPKEDSLRELYKDGKEDLKDKSIKTRHRLKHMRHRIQGRIRRVRKRQPRDRRNH